MSRWYISVSNFILKFQFRQYSPDIVNDSVKCYGKRLAAFNAWFASWSISGKSWKLSIFTFCDNMCYYLDALLVKFFPVLSFCFISKTYLAEFYLWTRAFLARQHIRFTSNTHFLEREFLILSLTSPCQALSLYLGVLLWGSKLHSI